MIFEWDDFGANHVISDKCQSHDCRDQLERLRKLNPKFKATLFAIPGEMTYELHKWAYRNNDWIELAIHGFYHSSNHECEKMSYQEFDDNMQALLANKQAGFYKKIFRAPGWQISDDCIMWLQKNDFVLCDQGYNDDRRPHNMKAYVNYDGQFVAKNFSKLAPQLSPSVEVEAYHGHTWNVGWNGIYEDYDKVKTLVKKASKFQFISELF